MCKTAKAFGQTDNLRFAKFDEKSYIIDYTRTDHTKIVFFFLQSLDDALERALETALEVGYRHIDTAERYMNEDVIGRVLKRWFDSGKLKREDIFVTTKLSPMEMQADKVENSLRESLRKLQLDYVDLYLIHFPLSIISKDNDVYGDPDFDVLDIWKVNISIFKN